MLNHLFTYDTTLFTYDTILSETAKFIDFDLSLYNFKPLLLAQSKGPLFANINGTPGNDFFDGTADADVLNGLGGNDQIDALAGDDIVQGGEGDDILFGGDGNDHLWGNTQTFDSFSGHDQLFGGAGNDFLYYNYNGSGPGNVDLFDGGDGIDTFVQTTTNAGGAFRQINLTTGQFTWDGNLRGTLVNIENVTFSSNVSVVTGNGMNNRIEGTTNSANSTIYGEGGDDLIIGGGGTDSLYGGAGYDTVSYITSTSAVIVYLYDNLASDGLGAFDSIFEFEAVQGSFYNDIIYGDAAANALGGEAGDDILIGGGGLDLLLGGAGNDTYIIEDTGDVITELAGEGTADTVYTSVTYTLSDNVEIGVHTATDTAAFLSGNSGDNTLILSSTASGNQMDASLGNDLLYAVSNTIMYGGLGNDILVLQNFGNYAEGNAGDDIFIDQGTSNTIVEYAGEGTDTLYSFGLNVVLPDHVEILALIYSGTGSDAQNATGNDQNNTIIGTSGANILSGLGGNDFIIGGAGGDFIGGGLGLDVLQGNSGNDTFYWENSSQAGDIIQDWVSADDTLAFSGADWGFSAGQSLVEGVNFFSGTNFFRTGTGPAFFWDTDDTALWYDDDGIGGNRPFLVVDMQAFTTVDVSDFSFI